MMVLIKTWKFGSEGGGGEEKGAGKEGRERTVRVSRKNGNREEKNLKIDND